MEKIEDMEENEDDFSKWANYLFKEIERMNHSIENMEKRLHDLEIKQAVNSVKIGVFAGGGASVPVIGHFMYQYIVS